MTLDEFINFQITDGTKNQYRWVLGSFFKLIGKRPKGYEKRPLEEIESDLFSFYSKINRLAPKSVYLRINVVLNYLKFHNIRISPNKEQMLKSRLNSKRTVSRKETFTNSELGQLMQHATLRERALFMFLSSSGMRINEALQLRIENVDFEFEPAKVDIPANITKSNYPRTTFLTDEASAVVKQWIEYLPSYKEDVKKYNFTKKSNLEKIESGLLFPFSYNRAGELWIGLLKKSGSYKKDANTGRCTTTLHSLRRYFINRARQVIPKDIVDVFVGHETDLDRAYFQPTLKELASYYLKAEEELSLYGAVSQQKLKELELEIRRRDKKLESIEEKMKAFESIEGLSEILANLKKKGMGPKIK